MKIQESVGSNLIEVRQERGFVVLGFGDGRRYQIYACGKVEADYSADCWLEVERCDHPSPGDAPTPEFTHEERLEAARFILLLGTRGAIQPFTPRVAACAEEAMRRVRRTSEGS